MQALKVLLWCRALVEVTSLLRGAAREERASSFAGGELLSE